MLNDKTLLGLKSNKPSVFYGSVSGTLVAGVWKTDGADYVGYDRGVAPSDSIVFGSSTVPYLEELYDNRTVATFNFVPNDDYLMAFCSMVSLYVNESVSLDKAFYMRYPRFVQASGEIAYDSWVTYNVPKYFCTYISQKVGQDASGEILSIEPINFPHAFTEDQLRSLGKQKENYETTIGSCLTNKEYSVGEIFNGIVPKLEMENDYLFKFNNGSSYNIRIDYMLGQTIDLSDLGGG